MGKALLFIVLGSSLVLARQVLHAAENERDTGEDQLAYQEQVIAREIAASAFNVGMGEIRAYGEDLQDGVRALNGAANAGREGTYASGRFAGGRYSVRAELTSGHSVRVIARGFFGEAEHVMHDEYRVYVLTAREGGYVDVSFIESMAGYCSAVYYQAYTLHMPEGTVPEPIMLFPPDNRDRGTARPARLLYVEPGTQMNFFIGVDKNCSTRPSGISGTCEARAFARSNTIRLSDYDHVHHALLVEAGDLMGAEEDIWGLVEQKPGARNRWRIGWEDIHNTSWDRPESEDPVRSLQALKAFGYDGDGWPDADARGYRQLRDYGSRPDFSDQVIEVGVISRNDPAYQATVDAYRQQQADCGETSDVPPDPAPEPPPSDPPPSEPPPSEPPPSEPPPSDPPPSEPPPPADPPPSESETEEDRFNSFACSCRQSHKHKRPLLHRPPGNPSNEQLLCLPKNAVRTHLDRHDDIRLECDD